MISLFVRGEMSECIGLHGFYSQVLDVYRTIIMFAGKPKGQPCILKDIHFLPSVWCIIFAVFAELSSQMKHYQVKLSNLLCPLLRCEFLRSMLVIKGTRIFKLSTVLKT